MPLWLTLRGTGMVETAGYHELLRRAGLPRAELLHMGASAHSLSVPAQWTPREEATCVLGRIAWDARYGEQGMVFQGHEDEETEVLRLGIVVVQENFRA